MTKQDQQPNVVDVGLGWVTASVLCAAAGTVAAVILFVAYPQHVPWWSWVIFSPLTLFGFVSLFVGIIKADRAKKRCQHATTQIYITEQCTYCNKIVHEETNEGVTL